MELERCPDCIGHGMSPEFDQNHSICTWVECPTCSGYGQVEVGDYRRNLVEFNSSIQERNQTFIHNHWLSGYGIGEICPF
jgi:hypothetical protein